MVDSAPRSDRANKARMTVELACSRVTLVQKVALIGGAVALSLGIAACGGSDEPTATPSPTVNDLPTSTSSALTLPSGWDAPEPASIVPISGSSNDGVLVATFAGAGELNTAADAYAKQLQAAGWKPDENNVVNKNSIWFKGDRRLDLSGTQTQAGKYDLVITIEPKA